jgi:hypothetical protein
VLGIVSPPSLHQARALSEVLGGSSSLEPAQSHENRFSLLCLVIRAPWVWPLLFFERAQRAPPTSESLEEAQSWVGAFAHWSHHEHQHSALKLVTPQQRPSRLDQAIRNKRKAVYAAAKLRNPHPEIPGTGNCQQPCGSILRKMTSPSKRRRETMRQLP